MNYKKIIQVSAIFLLSFIFFTGCQSSETSTLDSAPPTSESTSDDQSNSADTSEQTETATYTTSELASFDGINNKCLVAVSGVVYDVTASDEWENGVHKDSNGQATCGKDLTSVINSSPHGRSVLTSSPDVIKVGELK